MSSNADESMMQDLWDLLEVCSCWRETQPIRQYLLRPDGSKSLSPREMNAGEISLK